MFVVVVLYCVQSEEFFISFFQFFSWAILILNNMFVVVVLYCVQLLSEEIFISIVSVFSWARLILNNKFVVVVLYCVQFFLEVFFSKIILFFLVLSFANTFLFYIFSPPFFWNSPTVWWNPQKNIQTIFQGGSP